MQPVWNRIFVQIEKRFQDEIVTDSGLRLYKDTSFKPEENSTIEGVVTHIPLKVTKQPDFYHNVQVGDKLYFHYNVVMDESNCIVVDGEQYWMVEYFHAIARVREDVKPVGEYVLVKPIQEEVNSTIVLPDHLKKVEGTKGVVYASNHPELAEGDIVEYEKRGKFWNVIEGERVYCMGIRYIMFKHE